MCEIPVVTAFINHAVLFLLFSLYILDVNSCKNLMFLPLSSNEKYMKPQFEKLRNLLENTR